MSGYRNRENGTKTTIIHKDYFRDFFSILTPPQGRIMSPGEIRVLNLAESDPVSRVIGLLLARYVLLKTANVLVFRMKPTR